MQLQQGVSERLACVIREKEVLQAGLDYERSERESLGEHAQSYA